MKIKLQDGIHLLLKIEKDLYCLKMKEEQYKTFSEIFPLLFTDSSMTEDTDNGVNIKKSNIGIIYDEFLIDAKIDREILNEDLDKVDNKDYIVVYNSGGYLQPLELSKNQETSIDNLFDLIYGNPETKALEIEFFDDKVGVIRDEFI